MSGGHPSASTGLRATLEAAVGESGLKLKDLTVLAPQNDPFRVDTPSGHRDGGWLADRLGQLGRTDPIHLRGLHYVLLGEEKPDGTPYTNTEDDWAWLQVRAAKAARWLGLIPFESIVDQRNAPPVVREFERPEPFTTISVGNVDVTVPDDLAPEPILVDFRGVQSYRLVLFGEKVSLEPVLAPIADDRHADLYLPTGEASDTMIHTMARAGAEDGRRLIVFYLSDCDPAGWQMAVSVARKLQALEALEFPGLQFEVRPVALTPDQVREHGLPSTPLKGTERRAGAWEREMGVQQTEIDSIATLHPELLDRMVRRAIKPFYDTGLDERVREARREWEARALEALTAELGADQLEALRVSAEEKLAGLAEQVDGLNDALRVDVAAGVDLPDVPGIPAARVDGGNGLPSPLIDSDWSHADGSLRLIDHKAYRNGK